ncbi:MAG: ADP-ribosyltransferase [Janthinobacterium lividum]
MPLGSLMSRFSLFKKPKPRYDRAAPHGAVEKDSQVILDELLRKINQPAAASSASAPAFAASGSPLADFQDAAYPVLSGGAVGQAARIGAFLVLGNGQGARKAPATSSRVRRRFAKPNSKLLKQVQKQARAGYSSMNAKARTAMFEYTGAEYSAMNAYLRENDLFNQGFMMSGGGQKQLTPEQMADTPGRVQELQNGLKKLPEDLPQGLLLSRNIILPAADAAFLGQAKSLVLQELGFLSTSLNPTVFDDTVPQANEQKVQFRLDVGPGVKGLYVGPGSKSPTETISAIPDEAEVVLPANTRLHIVKVHRVRGPGYDQNGFGTKQPEDVIVVRGRILPSV